MSYPLSFSKSILVVIFISDKIRQGQFEFLSTQMIAEVLDIPKPTLVKIFQGLSMAGIIETREGKLGGIRLVRQPSEITILDILNATEKGKSLFQTTFHIMAEGKRPDNAQKVVRSLLMDAEDQMKQVLASRNIEEILIEMGK
ncbi:Rrf2 family transcriptional regulator [Marinoscillum sp. 108]|jgi:Rrf2 family protein|uniref:RrF2 family transcriptional regulator n=1 Tax=Marinoscillum sp. 108 TaxID=2653151 RepID=UPI0012F020B2|nr:Rrf2 family transcriptional regulator [Marinoscillum sp. 108]VXD14171.1 Rrf2 family transcriptional regulator [Marinoscillum sp. 108]